MPAAAPSAMSPRPAGGPEGGGTSRGRASEQSSSGIRLPKSHRLLRLAGRIAVGPAVAFLAELHLDDAVAAVGREQARVGSDSAPVGVGRRRHVLRAVVALLGARRDAVAADEF